MDGSAPHGLQVDEGVGRADGRRSPSRSQDPLLQTVGHRRRGARPRVRGLPGAGAAASRSRGGSSSTRLPDAELARTPRRNRPSRRRRALPAHVRRGVGTRTAGARRRSCHRPAPAVPGRVRDPRHHLDVPRPPASRARPARGQCRGRPPVGQRPDDLAGACTGSRQVALAAGDIERGMSAAQEAVDVGDDGKPSHHVAYAALALAEAHLLTGKPDRGLELLERASGGPDLPLVADSWRAYFLELLTRCRLALGERDAAERAAALADASADRLRTSAGPGVGRPRRRGGRARRRRRFGAAADLALRSADDRGRRRRARSKRPCRARSPAGRSPRPAIATAPSRSSSTPPRRSTPSARSATAMPPNASCASSASTSTGAPSRRRPTARASTRSPSASSRSPASSSTARPTARSPRSCSSARRPSRPTSATSSPSSAPTPASKSRASSSVPTGWRQRGRKRTRNGSRHRCALADTGPDVMPSA